MESDWKKLTARAPLWRERYLAKRNALLADILNDSFKTETERFWAASEELEKTAKIMHACLDGYSRSNMDFHLILMRGHGMLLREDLADFSPELQQQIFGEAPAEVAGQRY